MGRGTHAIKPRGQRFGYGGQRRASFLGGRGREGRHWGTWSGMGPFPSLVEIERIGGSRRQHDSLRVSMVRTFSEAMVWMTSAGGVPSSSVMMENWLTSTISVWSCHCAVPTYGPFLGTMAFPLASLRRYILYSRYQQRHRTFAMST